jgi:hypothetical protein
MKHLIRASVMTLAVAVSVSAQTPDAAGSWNVRVNAPDGPHDATLTLTKSGEALTGTIKGADGEYKVEGTQKGADVSLSFTYKGNDGPVPITLKGTIAGDGVSGPATLGDSAGDWTGKRPGAASASAASTATSSALDVTGAWAFEVTTPNGSGTPTVTFTQAGEKLTGTYAGQFGEAPIEGTLKNGQISFGIDLTIQDMKLHITYAGTVTKDGMKGTASFGDFGEGAFTAHRK